MKTKFLLITVFVFFLGTKLCNAQDQDRLSVQYASQYSERNLGWGYISSVILNGLEQLYLVTGDSNYYHAIKAMTDEEISEYGEFIFKTGLYDSWSVDNVRPASHLPMLYRLTGDERYSMAADTVFISIQNAPRNSYDGIWHKHYYYNEILLDGIFMGCPFYAAYNKVFNRPELQEDVVHWIAEMYAHTWDPDKKLLYHGWYDYENDTTGTWPYWDYEQTGVSTVFWGRSIGWYAMALVDVLDILPGDHPQRDSLIGIFSNLAEGIAMYQDPDSLVWWQVVDQPKRDSNWIESSASSMFVYALAKGVRMGYIDSVYLETATTGYQGILDKFLFEDRNGLALKSVCTGTIVGPDYAYYVERRRDDGGGHADGAFILACIEMEMMDTLYPPGLLGIDSVVNGAICISWNKNQHNVAGYILERKQNGSFTKIADLGADSAFYSDSLIDPNSDYIYRVCAYTESDTSRWSNHLKVTSANENGLPSPAFQPFPENNATDIEPVQILKWKKGLLADYHQLYFGTTDPPPFVADIYEISFTPDNLQPDSVYYWRIDEVNEKGITVGETWRFDMEKTETAVFLQNIANLSIYPNPASEMVFIENLEAGSTVSIYDPSGKMYHCDVIYNERLKIDIKSWQKGIFIIQIKSTDGTFYAKLLKE